MSSQALASRTGQTNRRNFLQWIAGAIAGLFLRPGVAQANEVDATTTEDSMPLTRINHFVAKGESADELYALIESFLPYIRDSDGCHGVELLRDTEDPTRIVVLERWRDAEAHRASADNVPPDVFPKAMALLAEPPSGSYYR